jgi:4'-phosphopantetheinyl transferase
VAVAIWTIRLDAADRPLKIAAALLSPDERTRAEAFRIEAARRRFIIARAALRQILAQELKRDPAEIEFRTGPHGKPALVTPPADPFDFNLSHSGDLALVAVSRIGEVGVDVEKLRPLPGAQRLADRFFLPQESAALRQMPESGRAAAFFNLWTRKEALAKATGQGIAHSLTRFEVSWEAVAVLKSVDGDAQTAAQWSLHAFEPAPGYVAAIAVHSPESQFAIHSFQSEFCPPPITHHASRITSQA